MKGEMYFLSQTKSNIYDPYALTDVSRNYANAHNGCESKGRGRLDRFRTKVRGCVLAVWVVDGAVSFRSVTVVATDFHFIFTWNGKDN